jgi:hypothetical protein
MNYDPRYGVYMPDGALRAAGIGNTSNPAILAQQPALIDPASIPVPAPRPALTTGLPDTVHEYDMPMPPALLPQAPPSRPANPNAAPATAARRDVVRMAQGLPDMPERPDMTLSGGEQLMRIGGAILGGAQKGGLAAMEAGSNTLGKINDYNRAQQLAEYTEQVNTRNALVKAQQEARKAEMERQTKLDVQRLINEKAAAGKDAKPPMQSPYMPIVLDSIDTALNLVDKHGNLVAGFFGDKLKDIAGTPAADLRNNIETIVSSIGFDRLQKMRDDSPTGGALGQVSERELSQLNASLGSLQQSQSVEQLVYNLKRVKAHYQSTVQAIYNQQIEYARRNGLPMPDAPVGLPSASQGRSAQQPAQQQSSASSADMSDADLFNMYSQ